MQTPYEITGEWTSRDDGEAFLDAAATKYGFPVETLATSVEGRPVRAALIGAHPDNAEQVVLLVAMQHGNEPASREGAFALIRDLAQVEPRYTKIWRQDSPPPAGTHYAWLGEPHDSVSVRLDGDGNETARNHVPDPQFRGDLSGALIRGEYEVSDGWLRLETAGAIPYFGASIAVTPGQFAAFRFAMRWGQGIGRFRIQFQFRNSSGGSVSNVQIAIDYSDMPHGGDMQFAHLVPNTATEVRAYVWLYQEGGWVHPEDGAHAFMSRWRFDTADSEDAALAQVETYFDGDTGSDRANDLWYNQDGVPHEWENGTGWVELSEHPTLDYLDKTSWVIIPTLNIDRVHMQRRNANNVDLNRDWEDKSQSETWAVLDVLDNWQPTLVIDAHEMFHGFDAWVGLSTPSTNVPVHPEISRVSGLAHEHAIQAIIDSRSTYADYGETGAMTLRTYAGTQHASSILIETYAWNEEREGYLRVQDQITVMHALVEHHQLEYDQYRAAADISRNPALAVTGGGVPFFTMWDNPKAYLQGTAIADAYIHTSKGQIRVYDHLGTLL